MARRVFVHDFKPDGVFCPWVEAKVVLSRCLKCPMNETGRVTRLDLDEARGKGFIGCRFTGEGDQQPPPEIVKGTKAYKST